MDLPPTMLRATLYTNNFVGNINVARDITAHSIVAGNVNANNINISAGVGGNLTANNFVGNFVGNVIAANVVSDSVTVSGNIRGALANIGNLATGQINVSGNVVLSPGKSIFASQMPFFWTSSIHGNPATGANLIVTGAMVDDATYIDAQSGVRLTRAVNALNGSIKWNVIDFDFTKDFTMRSFIYMGSEADGIWFGVGASDPGTGITYGGNTGGRATRLWTYTYQYTEMFGGSGQRIGQLQNNNANLQALWIAADLTIRSIGNRRYMHVFANNQLQNSVDISGWVPGGDYIFIGAGTGGANAEHYVNHVELKYI
jgi:hypothetical protein